MKQYWELKAQAGDALLLFRMGDFYELFADDAVEAARILEITLTSRDKNKPNPMPMAGVPHHSVQGYLQRLLKAGKKVAIGEQIEDPATVKGKQIVRRAVTRIFTPGVQFDAEGSDANYLAAVIAMPDSDRWAIACLDASTGEALVSGLLDSDALGNELATLPIRHVVHLGPAAKKLDALAALTNTGVLTEELPPNYLALPTALLTLKRHYEIENLEAFVSEETAAHALGVVVAYALRTQQQERLAHLRLPAPLHRPRTLALGPRTPQHLDLVPGLSNEGAPHLYQVINRTRNALGARQLRRWLLAPLKSPAEITARQAAVRELHGAEGAGAATDKLSTLLSEIYDLERISGRINARLANPRDTLALGRSLGTLAGLGSLLARAQAPLLADLRQKVERLRDTLSPLAQRIVTTQRDDAPLVSREGGIFNLGTTPELDRLLTIGSEGQQWLVELETREREATGIPSLKVRYNRVFGYYIEITQAHLKNAPAHYQRKQTTVGAERFFTEELKKFEDEIVNATARQRSLEQGLFDELLEAVRAQTPAIMETAQLLGELDSLVSLARLAAEPGWVFPAIDDSLELAIEAGRHPLVDLSSRGTFVPNDVALGPDSQLTMIITGPNMGGKSTVMRQTALIVILGQMGAPVPAAKARWGAVSSLHTRIGAHDAIARGQSTFMVEMSELAHILHHADDRSLIILDEIGRGTSTYDGISVAWAALEWICTRIQARTLFATHYHELTRLTGELPRVANFHMGVDAAQRGRGSAGGTLRFLYKLKAGPANESFGIHVARIAGLPKPVIERAWSVLEELERSATHSQGHGASADQLSLFAPRAATAAALTATTQIAEPVAEIPHPVLLELEKTDANAMTPIQALNFVVKLREMVTAAESALS